MRFFSPILLLAAALAAAAQIPAAAPVLPASPLPAGLAFFGSYNQLSTPRYTGGISAIYPVAGSLGLYGTTTADVYPQRATDPATGRSFWAVQAGVRQGLHKDVLDAGRVSFLIGGDLGPGISQVSTGFSFSLTGSFATTAVVQIAPAFSLVLPVRMLYIPRIGWNPVIEPGFVINLKKLPPKTP